MSTALSPCSNGMRTYKAFGSLDMLNQIYNVTVVDQRAVRRDREYEWVMMGWTLHPVFKDKREYEDSRHVVLFSGLRGGQGDLG